MNSTAIIILAAGSSSRLGRPKQLLVYNGKALISNVVDAALGAKLGPVIVVTGCFAEELIAVVQDKDVCIVYNANWAEGMASGLVAGLEALLLASPTVENVILAVCDQPFVSSEILSRLLFVKNKSEKTVVASAYADTLGTPVLFNKKHFNALSRLRGAEGAKHLFNQLKDDLISLPFPKGSVDIDTEADYIKLVND